MYNSLNGVISKKEIGSQNSQLYLELSGVEWVCECSRTTLQSLPDLGRKARVYTYLVHREDQHYLCGFATEVERTMFFELNGVDGIGPKQALKILGAIPSQRLMAVLEAGDLAALEAIPGVGKKTAQKMVLALKGKLIMDEDSPNQKTGANRSDLGEYEDLAQALVAMGYERKSVADLIKRLIPEYASLDRHKQDQEMMRRAIVELS